MNKKIKLSLIMLLSIGSISIASIPLVSCGRSKDPISPTSSPKNSVIEAIETPTGVSVEIDNFGVAADANNSEKWALFSLLWKVATDNLAEEDMININIVRDTTSGATTFTVSSKNVDTLILIGNLVSSTITPTLKISILSLKPNPIVSIAAAILGVAANADNSAKLALFNLIWSTTTESLGEDDMANVKIDSSAPPGATIFTVSSKNVDTLTLKGNLVSSTITPTLKISILSLKPNPIISVGIANAGVGEVSDAAKMNLFILIWNSSSGDHIERDDMANITISKEAQSDGTIFTIYSKNNAILTLTGELVSNTITIN